MSKGKWIIKKSVAYSGPSISKEHFFQMIQYHRFTTKKIRERNLDTLYEELMVYLKKPRFRDYKRSNYNLLFKNGLIKREKRGLTRYE